MWRRWTSHKYIWILHFVQIFLSDNRKCLQQIIVSINGVCTQTTKKRKRRKMSIKGIQKMGMVCISLYLHSWLLSLSFRKSPAAQCKKTTHIYFDFIIRILRWFEMYCEHHNKFYCNETWTCEQPSISMSHGHKFNHSIACQNSFVFILILTIFLFHFAINICF